MTLGEKHPLQPPPFSILKMGEVQKSFHIEKTPKTQFTIESRQQASSSILQGGGRPGWGVNPPFAHQGCKLIEKPTSRR